VEIAALEAMLARGQDSALLRYGLGVAYRGQGDRERAIEHLRAAVAQDPVYSAAWKLLGLTLTESGDPAQARQAYEEGIHAAERRGDKQAAREMAVFLRRLPKA